MWLVQTGSGMLWFLKGNKNALRHGRYSAEAVAWRRRMGTLLRALSECKCLRSTSSTNVGSLQTARCSVT